jgi:hypothetical protein
MIEILNFKVKKILRNSHHKIWATDFNYSLKFIYKHIQLKINDTLIVVIGWKMSIADGYQGYTEVYQCKYWIILH